MTRWLILGSNGQLGHDLMTVLNDRNQPVVGLDLPMIDITDAESVEQALTAYAPDVVVNAAAYTAVDNAESDETTAMAVNGLGPEVLASACAQRPTVKLVQISTDYVFSGDATAPYQEGAPTDPKSAYGRTKLAGEMAVLNLLPDRGFVLRTAWLYGANGQNFVKTMLRLEATHGTLSVVADQRGQPTWSHDLAVQIVALIGAAAPAGIYHATNSGEATWFEFTREILSLIGADRQRVLPTTTDRFPRPAPRPAYSVLGHDRWKDSGVAPMRDWRSALAEALPSVRAQHDLDGARPEPDAV